MQCRLDGDDTRWRSDEFRMLTLDLLPLHYLRESPSPFVDLSLQGQAS